MTTTSTSAPWEARSGARKMACGSFHRTIRDHGCNCAILKLCNVRLPKILVAILAGAPGRRWGFSLPGRKLPQTFEQPVK